MLNDTKFREATRFIRGNLKATPIGPWSVKLSRKYECVKCGKKSNRIVGAIVKLDNRGNHYDVGPWCHDCLWQWVRDVS
jgi:hypothetical protein